MLARNKELHWNCHCLQFSSYVMYQSNRSFNIPPAKPRAFELLKNLCSNSPSPRQKAVQMPTIYPFQVIKNAENLSSASSADKSKIQKGCHKAAIFSFKSLNSPFRATCRPPPLFINPRSINGTRSTKSKL